MAKKRRRSRHGPPQPFYSKFHKRWIVRYVQNGKRSQKNFRDKAAACQFATDLWQNMQDGIHCENMTVRDLVAKFLASKSNLSASTQADYKRTLEQASPLFTVPIRVLRPLDLDQLIESLPSTAARQRLRNKLSMMFRQAVAWELIRRNPVDGTRTQKHRTAKAEIFSPSEVSAILKAGKKLRLIGLIDLGLTLGPRPEELFGFQWGDWDESAETLSVRRKVAEVEGALEVGPPKTAAGSRDLLLPAHITKRLQDRRVAALKEGRASKDDWIFPSRSGGPMRRTNLRAKIWKPLLERAKVPYRKAYCMRHTAASTMLNGTNGVPGLPLSVVSAILGHDNPQITLEVYSHVLQAEHQQVRSFWDRANGGV